jgi:5-methylcytosine-specific restriction endonuclease McrA
LAKKDTRTYEERRGYLIAAVRKRRLKIRQMAIAAKGGRCEKCGYNRCIEALEFHHKSGLDKEFGLSERGYARSWKRVEKELEKCVLLCANCHRETHAEVAAPGGNARMKNRVNSGKPVP